MKSARRLNYEKNRCVMKWSWKCAPVYVFLSFAESILSGINYAICASHTKELFHILGAEHDFDHALHMMTSFGVYLLIFYAFRYWYRQIYQPKAAERLSAAVSQELRRNLHESAPEEIAATTDEAGHFISRCLPEGTRVLKRIVGVFALASVLVPVDIVMAVMSLLVSVLIGLLFRRGQPKGKHSPLRVFRQADSAIEGVLELTNCAFMIFMLAKATRVGEIDLGCFAVITSVLFQMARLVRRMFGEIVQLREYLLHIEGLPAGTQVYAALFGDMPLPEDDGETTEDLI